MGDLSENFSHEELDCQCGCGLTPTPRFVGRLERLRFSFDRPIYVNSGMRCPIHDASVHRARNPSFTEVRRYGSHTIGAVDVKVTGEDAADLCEFALRDSWTWRGIGVHQSGPSHQEFLHLDDIEGDRRFWSY